jgi:hypothetical protein
LIDLGSGSHLTEPLFRTLYQLVRLEFFSIKLNDFIAFSMHIYYIFHCKESEEKRMLDLMLSLKIFDLLYSMVGAGARAAGPASKFSPGAGAA